MKNIYKVYTKTVNDMDLYFVKKYTCFSDLENAPQILESMGMHKDFYKACHLAQITNEAVIHELSTQIYIPPKEAKVFALQRVSNSIWKNALHFLAKLRLAGMN